MRTPEPPRLAEGILRRVIGNPVAREGAIGDLREEFEAGCRARGARSARRGYWRATLTMALAYAWHRLRRIRGRIDIDLPDAPRRGDSLMQTITQDFRFAVRTLGKAYGFTLVAVLTLAFGIGATTAMFSLLSAAFLRPLPYDQPDRLVLGRATFDGGINPPMSAYDFFDYREQASTLDAFSAYTSFTRAVTVTGLEEPERVDSILISWDLFRTLGSDPQAGRHMSESEGQPGGDAVVMISDRMARRHFADAAAAVGEIIRLDGAPTTIVGVMPPDFHFAFDVDVWLPMRRDGPFAGARRFHNFLAVGRLADGVTLSQAQSEVDAISARLEALYPDSNEGKALLLTDLHETLVAGQSSALWLLMAGVSMVLLIACGNVANLLLARGSARRGELAVRGALGASRARLVRQLLTESLCVALLAGVAGVILAAWLQGLVLRLMPLETLGVHSLDMSPAVLLFAAAVAITTSLLFGTFPALQGAPTDVAQQLKSAGRSTAARRGARARGALVVAQVAASMVLLIGSGLMVRSLAGLADVSLGFEADDLVTLELLLSEADYPDAEQVRLFYGELLEQVRALPGVVDAGMASMLPILNPGNNVEVRAASQTAEEAAGNPWAYTRNVMPGYFRALGIPLISGRVLDDGDTSSGPRVMVIDETLAQALFAEADPLGQSVVVDYGEPVTARVVGVVGPVRLNGVQYGAGPTMYFPFAQMTSRTMRLAMRTDGDAAAAVAGLRDLVRRMDPNLPLTGLTTMETLIADSMSSTRAITGSLLLFSGIALALAVVGLYGVLAYHVSRHRREIGLRLAIGASRSSILVWVLSRGMRLVAIGVVLGIGAALASTRMIEALLFGVTGTDPATLSTVSLVFLVVALAACLLPAWRATRVDPIVTLAAD